MMIDKDIIHKIDPYNEEYWEYKGHDIIIIKIWVGSVSRDVKLISFPSLIAIGPNGVEIRDDKYHRLFVIEDKYSFDNITLPTTIYNVNHCITDTKFIEKQKIKRYFTDYLSYKIRQYDKNIYTLYDKIDYYSSNNNKESERIINKIENEISILTTLKDNHSRLLNNFDLELDKSLNFI
jgi:hypothetical protein